VGAAASSAAIAQRLDAVYVRGGRAGGARRSMHFPNVQTNGQRPAIVDLRLACWVIPLGGGFNADVEPGMFLE
jgi:hypothetical protein